MMKLAAVILLLVGLPVLGSAKVEAEVSAAIYKVRASDCVTGDDRALTGFLSMSQKGMVTALHGVVGCDTIRALNDVGQVFRNLEIVSVDMGADIAVLHSGELESFIDEHPDQTLTFSSDQSDSVRVIGYPLDLGEQIETQNIRIESVKPLLNLVPPSELEDFAICASPSLAQQVFSLEGTIRPGESGAPIINALDQVVGVGMGGLDAGRIAIVWASRWEDVHLRNADDMAAELTERAERYCPTNRFSSASGGCDPGDPSITIRADQTSGLRPLLTNFSVEADTEFDNFEWDFGDGRSSSQRNALHTFNTIGTFSVTVRASGKCGEASDNLQISTVQVPEQSFRISLGGYGSSLRMDESGDYTDLRRIKDAFDSWDTGNNDFRYQVVPGTAQTVLVTLMSGESNLFIVSRDAAQMFLSRSPDTFKSWDRVINLQMYGDADLLRVGSEGEENVFGIPHGDLIFLLPAWASGEDLEGIGSFIAWLTVMS